MCFICDGATVATVSTSLSVVQPPPPPSSLSFHSSDCGRFKTNRAHVKDTNVNMMIIQKYSFSQSVALGRLPQRHKTNSRLGNQRSMLYVHDEAQGGMLCVNKCHMFVRFLQFIFHFVAIETISICSRNSESVVGSKRLFGRSFRRRPW